MNEQQAKKLREPFPAEQIGKLPKLTCKDCSNSQTKNCPKHSKTKCSECGNYISTAHIHLDYAGHAAVCDRLLGVDPNFSYRVVSTDPTTGSPTLVKNDGGMPGEPLGLWIELTVCDVTRPGFGGGKNAKECISDALRNAAMRFGVGLDLWSKEDLHPETLSAGGGGLSETSGDAPAVANAQPPAENASQEQFAEIESLIQDCASARGKTVAEVKAALTTDYGPLSALSVEQATELVGKLKRWAKAQAAA